MPFFIEGNKFLQGSKSGQFEATGGYVIACADSSQRLTYVPIQSSIRRREEGKGGMYNWDYLFMLLSVSSRSLGFSDSSPASSDSASPQ